MRSACAKRSSAQPGTSTESWRRCSPPEPYRPRPRSRSPAAWSSSSPCGLRFATGVSATSRPRPIGSRAGPDWIDGRRSERTTFPNPARVDEAGGRRYLRRSMASAPRLRIPPVPALLIAGTSLQAGAAIAKQLFPALGPAGASGVRLSFAAVLLLAFFRPRLTRLGWARWKAVIPYGVALGGMNFSFYLALERIPLGLAVTLEFLGPLGVALFGSRRPSDVAWVLLAGGGIFLLSPWAGGAGSIDPVGAALALLAGAFWAAYIVLGARTAGKLSEVES